MAPCFESRMSPAEQINREKSKIFETVPLPVLTKFYELHFGPAKEGADRDYLLFWIEQGVEPFVKEPTPTETWQWNPDGYIARLWSRWGFNGSTFNIDKLQPRH